MKIDKPTSWSHSSLSAYEQCPHKWYNQRILKLPEPENMYLAKGNAVHAMAEDYLNGKLDTVPKPLQKFATEFENLRKHGAVAEEQLCLDVNWSAVHEGWESDATWLRAKTDARIVNYVVDFKTGKVYDYHVEQAELYATILMVMHGYATVDVEFWYLDAGTAKAWTFYMEDQPEVIDKWQTRVDVMMSDTEYLPKENKYCNYCYVKSLCPLKKKK